MNKFLILYTYMTDIKIDDFHKKKACLSDKCVHNIPQHIDCLNISN